jgi:hypothetical protein
VLIILYFQLNDIVLRKGLLIFFSKHLTVLLAGAGEEHSLWTSARRDEHWFRWRCGGWVTPWAPQRIDSDDACLAIAFSRQLGGRIEWRDVSCDEPQQLACEVAVDDML